METITNNNLSYKLKKSLRASFLDGIFASIMFGFTTNYVTPFALVLEAKKLQIGLLNSIPQLFGSIAQLKVGDMIEKIKSRVKIITQFAILQAICYVLIIFLLFLPNKVRFSYYLVMITLSTVFGTILSAPWASLMSDTVEKDKYGEYFSWRGKVLGVITLISNFVAGIFLYFVKNKFLGFVTIFFVSGICRFVSSLYLSKMVDIPIKIDKDKKFTYIDFIRRVKDSNFVKFVLFVSLINFATFIAAPFFSVYMLKDLKMSYYMYTVITTSSALTSLLFLPFWGRMADKYGNAKIVKVTGAFVGVLPILWLFSKNYVYLIIINTFAGHIWAGFNLCSVNFIFDAASSEVRTRCIGYFNFTNGMLIFLGTLLSGWFATHLPKLFFETNLLTLFLLSGILRFLVYILLYSKFKEVKKVEKVEEKDLLLTVLGIKPVLEFSEQLMYYIRKFRTVKY